MPTWTGIPQDTFENMFAELQNRLAWIMSRLDSKNIREIDATKVTVKNLVVGENVQMGPDAYISWGNITGDKNYNDLAGKPNISGIALSTIQSTYIDGNGVWTPNVYATNINTLYGKITNAQIDYITANQINAAFGKIQSAQIDNLSANQITTGTLDGIKISLHGNDFSSSITWDNGNSISVDPITDSMYLGGETLYQSDSTGNYPLPKCGGGQKLKLQVYGGYLEVYDGATYQGRVLLT